MFIKFLKKLFTPKKEIVKEIPKPKPMMCPQHTRFKKSCPACLQVRGYV
tara:strand:+ start:291 stop:437 length:147 start_codon:yes stop_codon:yes gene_type:complete